MGIQGDSSAQVLVPVEQDVVPFYGRDLVAVRLADGQICAVLRWLCEGLNLDPHGQLQRINRRTALARELVLVQVQTAGGPQTMPALTLDVLPGWLFGIDENRVKPEAREDVIRFQSECVRVLAEHFARKHRPALAAPQAVVSAEAMPQPERPAPDAPHSAMIEYHRAMAAWLEWQEDVAQWREQTEARLDDHEQQLGEIHSRLEGNEEISRMLAAFVARQGPQTLTPEHQATVKRMAARLHELSGISYGTIYADLNASFHVGRYSDSPDAEWERVTAWLQQCIATAERRKER